jgi:hypothetical protein
LSGIEDEVAREWMRAMRAGDWEAAWRQSDRLPAHLVWNGTPFDGRRVRVRCLHGLGDTLMFMRFVPLIAARASHVDFLVQPVLLDLLRGLPGLGEVSNAWTDDPPPCDVEIEVMELAYALRCRIDTVPAPYPHLASRARARPLPVPTAAIADDARTRVAVLWSVSDWGARRSVPLRALEPLLSVPGVAFYSLQQGRAALDPDIERLGLTALSHRTEAIADAAAAMLAMDLVITPDAMPAHLAATLGLPTWVMLEHEPDWRWMQSRDDSPWYPTMRLFRQRTSGDWHSVATEIASQLALFKRVPAASGS